MYLKELSICKKNKWVVNTLGGILKRNEINQTS